jgi:hypothetical protein
MRPTLFLCVGLPVLCLAASALAADGDRSGLRELGAATGYGPSSRGNVQVVPLFVRGAWLLPRFIDEPLSKWHLDLEWAPEGWLAGVTDGQNAIEVGLNPIVFKLNYDRGQTFVPFGTFGVGVMYTGLQGLELGGPFQFDSFAGVGLHTFLTPTLALTLSWRLRHISNAGIKEPNRGLNTNFFLIGLDYFPWRAPAE